MTRVVCPVCGGTVPGGTDRPSELSICSVACGIRSGQPDRILRALREIEERAAPRPPQQS